jgi:hypothetical protein
MVKPDFAGARNPNHKHGMSNEGKKHPLYIVFYNMHARCYNEKNTKFKRYGGRGISICDEWHNKINFFTWAFLNGWQEGLTLDRKDNDGNYCPENCHWIGVGKNSQKKSTTKLSFEDAENIRYRISEGENEYDIALDYKVSHGTVWFIKNNITHRF